MALSGKIVISVEIKSPGEVFFDIFGRKRYDLPKLCPSDVPSVELIKGDWGAVGCTTRAHFFADGKAWVSEESIIAVDNENMSLTYNVVGGDLLKLYKKMEIRVEPTTSKDEGNFLTWTYEYEKVNEDVSDPDNLKGFVNQITKTIDAHYLMSTNT